MPVEKWAGLLLIQVHKPWVVFIHRHLVIVSINCKGTGLRKIKQGWDSVRERMQMQWYGERLLVSFPRNNVTEAKNILFGIANTEKRGLLRKKTMHLTILVILFPMILWQAFFDLYKIAEYSHGSGPNGKGFQGACLKYACFQGSPKSAKFRLW